MPRFVRLLIFVWAPVLYSLVLHGQDAGMVLRTSVTYNTQKATLTLTDDQRQKADQLGREAQQAAQARKYGDAMRAYYQGLAVMRSVPWTPAFELASSFQGRLDHAIVEPGKPVTVTLTPLYTSERAAAVKMNAALFLVPVKKKGRGEEPGRRGAGGSGGAAVHRAREDPRRAGGRLRRGGPARSRRSRLRSGSRAGCV